jgi:hypothetical protein
MLMRRARALLAVLVLAGTLGVPSGPVSAGPNENAKLLFHLVPTKKGKKLNCTTPGVQTAAEVVTRGELEQEYLVYVLITDFVPEDGITGVQFGISFDDAEESGVDILAWQHCTLYEWPMDGWPGTDTGNLLTWHQLDDCQRSIPLVVGYFTVTAYSADRFKLIPRPADGLARVAACGLNNVNAPERLDNIKLENLGWVDFGGNAGYNPWDPEQNLLKVQEQFKPRQK